MGYRKLWIALILLLGLAALCLWAFERMALAEQWTAQERNEYAILAMVGFLCLPVLFLIFSNFFKELRTDLVQLRMNTLELAWSDPDQRSIVLLGKHAHRSDDDTQPVSYTWMYVYLSLLTGSSKIYHAKANREDEKAVAYFNQKSNLNSELSGLRLLSHELPNAWTVERQEGKIKISGTQHLSGIRLEYKEVDRADYLLPGGYAAYVLESCLIFVHPYSNALDEGMHVVCLDKANGKVRWEKRI